MREGGFKWRKHAYQKYSQMARTGNNCRAKLATITTGYTPDLGTWTTKSSYYDYPVLKAPAWALGIIWLFFLWWLAAGCYVMPVSLHFLVRLKIARGLLGFIFHSSQCYHVNSSHQGSRQTRPLFCTCCVSSRSNHLCRWTWGLISFSLFSAVTAVIQAARDGTLGAGGITIVAALPQRFSGDTWLGFRCFPGWLHRVLLMLLVFLYGHVARFWVRLYFFRVFYQLGIDLIGITSHSHTYPGST